MKEFMALCITAMIMLTIIAAICLIIAFVGNIRSRDYVGIAANVVMTGACGMLVWMTSEIIKIAAI